MLQQGKDNVIYSTVQYSTVQYSTVQYSTVQYSNAVGEKDKVIYDKNQFFQVLTLASAGEVTVSLGENGWAWLVSGRRLVVWRSVQGRFCSQNSVILIIITFNKCHSVENLCQKYDWFPTFSFKQIKMPLLILQQNPEGPLS